MASLLPYNISLNSTSPAFLYKPFRDGYFGSEGDPAHSWRSTFSNLTTTWPIPNIENVGNGVPLRETYLDGANVTLDFEGTAVYLCLTSFADTFFEFTVDQQPITSIGSGSDPACAHTGATQVVYANGLTYANHSATIRVNTAGSSPDFQFFGGIVTIGLSGTNATTVLVDDTDPGWNYAPQNGAWEYYDPAGGDTLGDYNMTAHLICSYGSSYTASYTFNGSSAVQLLGMCNLNLGPFTVQLDDRSYIYNASDLWRQAQQVMFFAGNLDPTQTHTITVMNFDVNAPHAQQPIGNDFYPCLVIDGLILTQTTPNTSQREPKGSLTPVTAIVGGVVGGVAAFAVLLFLLWFFVWRGKRRNLKRSPSFDIDPFSPVMVEPMPYSLSDHAYTSLPAEDQAVGAGEAATYPMSHVKPRGNAGDNRSGHAAASSSATLPITPRVPTKTRRDALLAGQNPSPPTLQLPQEICLTLSPQPSSTSPPPPATRYPEPSTAELVDLLNRRLRAEYSADDEVEPPNYEPVD